jgi:hypothetical protein
VKTPPFFISKMAKYKNMNAFYRKSNQDKIMQRIYVADRSTFFADQSLQAQL